jgi:hypothetical protein
MGMQKRINAHLSRLAGNSKSAAASQRITSDPVRFTTTSAVTGPNRPRQSSSLSNIHPDRRRDYFV